MAFSSIDLNGCTPETVAPLTGHHTSSFAGAWLAIEPDDPADVLVDVLPAPDPAEEVDVEVEVVTTLLEVVADVEMTGLEVAIVDVAALVMLVVPVWVVP